MGWQIESNAFRPTSFDVAHVSDAIFEHKTHKGGRENWCITPQERIGGCDNEDLHEPLEPETNKQLRQSGDWNHFGGNTIIRRRRSWDKRSQRDRTDWRRSGKRRRRSCRNSRFFDFFLIFLNSMRTRNQFIDLSQNTNRQAKPEEKEIKHGRSARTEIRHTQRRQTEVKNAAIIKHPIPSQIPDW